MYASLEDVRGVAVADRALEELVGFRIVDAAALLDNPREHLPDALRDSARATRVELTPR